ncbi:SDR family NAD(P)-dependent oxidoreductase [Chloroflexota bacterium]
MKLKDRVAIVTGGGYGIGKEYSFALANEGAKVVVADIKFEEAQRVAKEIVEKGKEALAINTNVSDENSTLEMAKKTYDRFGRIDILVNNAALFVALGKKPWEEIDTEEWDICMAVNLKGLFLCSKAVVPYMKLQGKGRIINISSGLAYRGFTGMLHYVTSKAGVLGFTRGLARELAGQNINVNSIAIGSTLSEGVIATGRISPEIQDMSRRQRCVQKDMYPKDISGTVIFLASDDSEFICGETIVVDGGIAFI